MCRFLSLVVVVLALIYCIATPSIIAKKALKCSYVTPEDSTIENYVTATGIIESMDYREIFIPSAVVPSKVNVSIGDYVEKGSIIAEIDVETTENVLKNSITSTTSMLSPDDGTENVIDSMLNKIGISIADSEDIAAMLSKVKSVEKTVKTTIPNQIVAPIDGVITNLSLSSGVLCQPIGAVARIENLDNMKAVINISESDIADISIGQQVNIEGAGFPDKEVLGNIAKIYPCVTKNSNGANFVSAEVYINESDVELKSGFSVNANILVEEASKACSLPYDVIKQSENNQEYVYVFENGRAIRRYITTGVEMPEAIEVTSGIGNDNIILKTDGPINDGSLVIIDGEDNGD